MELNYLLFGIVCTLIGIIYTSLVFKINKVEVKQETLIPKVQKLEDIQGTKIDIIVNELSDLKESNKLLTEKVNTLAHNFHNSKNVEGQLNQTMTAILKHLEKVEK
jgi:hypothetical protein